ncbi:PREDICTED: G-protein coupled receptor Mth2-like [Cyphomyrmex costatus]|uniref:G-protein coupled receptor Mth2 n=1 Tax=Cyphomyrmex costatus TaxID=456900 RepID=A0A151IQ63_9HYME|nr:PREDICTED: G-protein coupled receptor Mth2-like [Cyphomyrmex costatus]KYN08302.1 G-protein coupled receptor Mth2 [Cyphomyrmex costatus]
MYQPSIALCFAFLLAASSSEFLDNFANYSKQNDNSIVQFDLYVDRPTKYQNEEINLTQCNSHENSMKNNDEMQYESCINSTKSNCENNSVQYDHHREHTLKNHEENNQTYMEPSINSTEINDPMLQKINDNFTKVEDKNNSTSYELHRNPNKIFKIPFVQYEACCDNLTCIQLCCPFANNLTADGQCVHHGQKNFTFPKMYKDENNSKETLDELFLIVRDPCVEGGFGRRLLDHNTHLFLINGSLYQDDGTIISPTSYCFAILHRNVYDAFFCTDEHTKFATYESTFLLVSTPFLLLTFIIYSVLPEFRNVHGYTVRAYVSSVFITNAITYVDERIPNLAEKNYCVVLAYIYNFFFLSSFLWLNVTCFDLWWAFRKLRLHRTKAKHDKKKLILYSMYAWGITIIFNVVCVVMDNAPGLSKDLIRPEICVDKFWFSKSEAKILYFFIPVGVIVISNIIFFNLTTLTILYQKIRTAYQLKDLESNRHDRNKQRFNMYFMLFIVMEICWVLEILSWCFVIDIPTFFWYTVDIINSLQGAIIFIILVCTKRIKQMLLIRFGELSCNPFKILSNNSVASITTSSTTESRTISMQQVGSPN